MSLASIVANVPVVVTVPVKDVVSLASVVAIVPVTGGAVNNQPVLPPAFVECVPAYQLAIMKHYSY